MRTRRRRDSAEFKREALQRACEEGMTDVRVSEELGASTRQLRRWRDEQLPPAVLCRGWVEG